MSKPKFEVEESSYFRDIHFLYQIIALLKNVEEIKLFLKDLLTRTELRMFKRRWHIACLLDQGLDIRDVARESATSTATVDKIKKILDEGGGGLKIALKRTRKDRMRKKTGFVSSFTYRHARKLIYGKDIDLEG